MTASVVVDFSKEPEFPKKPTGEAPKVELVREQLATYVEGYQLARKTAPARIVLQASDFKHCLRRILARMQKPHREKAKAAWQERRKAGSQEKWRDARPEPITAADLTWPASPSKASATAVTAPSTSPDLEIPCSFAT